MDTSTLFSLQGRTALVTGGSRGIGKMIAAGFIAQGAKVYISSRKADVCDATADELGPNCISLPQDVSTVAGCQALADTYFEHEKSLDILVNNAGAAWGESFETFPESGWDKVMDLNVKSLFFLTQALHGPLKAAASKDRPGKVINIASIDGIRINPWETYSYQASNSGTGKALHGHRGPSKLANIVNPKRYVLDVPTFAIHLLESLKSDSSAHVPCKEIAGLLEDPVSQGSAS